MSDWTQLLLASPLMVAFVSVFLVKVYESWSTRKTAIGKDAVTDKTDERDKLWKRIESLEARAQMSDQRNDALVIENAKLNARVEVLEAQVAARAVHVAELEAERNQLRLDLRAARERIAILESIINEVQKGRQQ